MIDTREKYHAFKGDKWMVLTSDNLVLYDDCEGGEDEAEDLAWAYNYGAYDDEHAIQMITKRNGYLPTWVKYPAK